MNRILIVEDEDIIRSALKKLLTKSGYNVDDAASIDDALARFALNDYNLIISDLRLPGRPGTDLIPLANTVPVLIMTSYASLKSAVEAIKLGAVDYISKPFDHQDMLKAVAQFINNPTDVADKPKAILTPQGTQIIGSCQPMQELFKRIKKVAATDATVLIQGESGTGKELAAKAIHEQSTRTDANMVCVNCASIPETLIESELFGHEKGAFTGANSARHGLIEAADGGTLFLDEIGELPLEAQARLFRFLQEGEIRRVGSVQPKKVNVRLIAATHRNLKAMAKTGDFREDLYYRLYVMELRMPPLRERGDDIIEIAQKLLQKTASRMGTGDMQFSQSALNTMRHYNWPGNVRELENAIERAVILCDDHLIDTSILGLDLEPHSSLTGLEQTYAHNQSLHEQAHPELLAPAPEPENVSLSLDDYFQRFVLENQDQMSETALAKKLGVSRKCLWERRQKLGIPRKPKATTK
ncbi:MAG: sigma-54-dependent transcriptional regulator [Pontibacterium sp.]